ncbi:hypothetical protein NBRC116493_06140 [Aurantivibrio infirmus]
MENIKQSTDFQQVYDELQRCISEDSLAVPMLPTAAQRVIELVQNPDSDAAELAQQIQSDQGLAAHVMRVANSAAYSPASTLVSLQQAITRLGMNLIGEIALTVSIGTKVFQVPGFEKFVDGVWRHALLTALWSKEISRVCRKNVEATFLCGLLHSIGRPVTLQLLKDFEKSLGLSLTADEKITLVEDFSQAASIAAVTQWSMPALIIETVSHFNDFENAEKYSEQAATITAAAVFASFSMDSNLTPEETLREASALEILNIYQDDVTELLKMNSTIYNAMESMLQ